MSVLTWLILTISFMLTAMKQSDFMIVLLNVLGFIFMMIHTFHPYQFNLDVSRMTVMNELLVVHISLALISYVIFAIAFVNSIIYLMQFQNLKQKKFTQYFFRMSSLEQIEYIVFFCSLVGNVLLLVSLILGVQWGLMTVGLHIFVDLKVISSLLIFICYMVYIILRLVKQFKIISLIYFNIFLFLSCMINLIVITQLSSFHQWTGV
ncbi:cytochrome c biogenesis protein CcsA [Staphylococcus felis]|nr:cytochrome c biogenesis protein CcsA [Staphylococcus felis]UXR87798.1 cytochrome c biogenesis protein [Staphylococcus felis]